MLIHETLNKYPDMVPEESPLIVLDSKYDVYMDKNGKETKQTRQVTRRIKLVRNGEK